MHFIFNHDGIALKSSSEREPVVGQDKNSVRWSFHQFKVVESHLIYPAHHLNSLKSGQFVNTRKISHCCFAQVSLRSNLYFGAGQNEGERRKDSKRISQSSVMTQLCIIIFACFWKALIKLALTRQKTCLSAANGFIVWRNRILAALWQSRESQGGRRSVARRRPAIK